MDKLNSKEIYNTLITEALSILPTSQQYCNNFNGTSIYILQRILLLETKLSDS